MLLPAFFLTHRVAIPNALAGRALLDGITRLSARRTQLLGRGGGPIFRVGFGGIIILPLRGCAKRHGTELLGSRRCSVLFS